MPLTPVIPEAAQPLSGTAGSADDGLLGDPGDGQRAANARFSLAIATRSTARGSSAGPMAETSTPVAVWTAEHFT
ncbi:hypothetical protein D3C72_1837330 [compost metagenome]